MALVIKDRVRETSTTGGTGSLTLGGAVSGYQSFDAQMATGDKCFYCIAHRGQSEWETGIGTFTAPSTLARTTILESSNSDAAVDFTGGTKDVFITLPARRSGAGVRIAVIGDSLSAQWPLFAPAWPNVLETRLNSAGANVEVKVFATGSHTFFRANNTETYGSDTAVDAVIDFKPDVVIVELGGNDASASALGTGDARTLVQAQGDAEDLYDALAAGLPHAVLIQINLALYDSDNFTTSNVKNKGILPRFMTKKSSGILDSLDTSEYLDDDVSSANRGVLDDYASIMTTVDAITGVEMLPVDLFRVERLGVNLVDRTHYTQFGHALIASYVQKGLKDIAAFTALVPVIAEQLTGALFEGEDPDALFDDYLVGSGDGYVDNTPGVLNGEDTNSSWGSRVIHTDNWFMAYKASCIVGPTTVYNSVGPEQMLNIAIDDAAPNAVVSYSIDGAAFAASSMTTDGKGRARGQQALAFFALSNAAHTFRFKVGTAVFGPFTITMAASVVGNVNTTAVGNVGGGEDDLMTFSLPAGTLAAAKRGVKHVTFGTYASNTNPKSLRHYFGSSSFSISLPTSVAGAWRFEIDIVSTGVDAQSYFAYGIVQTGAATWVPIIFSGTATQDDGAAITIKCTVTVTDGGGGINNNDATQTFQRVYY